MSSLSACSGVGIRIPLDGNMDSAISCGCTMGSLP